MLVGQLALISAALFAGAAVYVSAVEQPARLTLDDRALLTEWKTSYARGKMMQAPLAIAGFVLGLAAWWQTRDAIWIVGAILMLANWPVTLGLIMPTNHKIEAIDNAAAGPQSRALIARWGGLHAIRTALGFAATLAFLWASLR